MLAPDPAEAHGPQEDAGHPQAHLRRRQEQEAPQDLAAGAHLAPGIAPAPPGGESAPDRDATSSLQTRTVEGGRGVGGGRAGLSWEMSRDADAGSFLLVRI